jgi:hypothetical protein
LPAPQLVHEAPGSALYVPGTQALQPIPGVTVHAVADGIAYRRSSVDTVCISLSVRCVSQMSTCAKSQSLVWPTLQFMHMFLVRPASIASICSCIVSPVHSDTLPSDRVLVPLATPSTSTLNGTTPPFLLHMTSQLLVGSTLASSVFETAAASTVPVGLYIVLDANLSTPRIPL